MNFRVHSLLYFAIGILFISLETVGAVFPGIFTKALIIPVLIWLYLRFVRGVWSPFHRLIVFALLFSWIGDVILQLAQFREVFFVGGLASFLVAQFLYLIAFFLTRGENILARRMYLVLPVVLYGVLILWLLWEGMEDMKAPVTIYTVVILTMLAGAVNRKEKVNPQSYQMVLLGAILFVVSDSMIAINKFTQPFELARVAIMTSYITAQYLIVIGCIRQYGLTLKE
jgi:uncharacterized membrane protein YhhN